MRTSPFFQLAAISIVVLVAITSCSGNAPVQADFSDSWEVVEVPRGAPIQIAVVVDPFAPDGQDTLRGASLALEDYGRVYRTDVELVQIEAACTQAGGETAAGTILGTPNIMAVVGLSCSEACLGALPILDINHYSVVSPTCEADQLTDQITHFDNFLRTTWANTGEAQVAAEFIFFELAARNAVILQSTETDSTDLSSAFEATFTSLGGSIVSIENIEEGDIGDVVSRVSELNYDVIYAPLNADLAAGLTAFLAGEGDGSVPFVGVRHIWNAQFIEEAGASANTIYASGPTIDQSGQRAQLREDYAANFGAEPVGLTYLFAYDAMWMLLDALVESAVADRGGTLQVGRQALNEALYATSNYSGVSGDITCSQWGDCGSATIGIGQLRDGSWSVVYVP